MSDQCVNYPSCGYLGCRGGAECQRDAARFGSRKSAPSDDVKMPPGARSWLDKLQPVHIATGQAYLRTDDMDMLLEIARAGLADRERLEAECRALAKLAADEPQFFNPLDAFAAQAIRDKWLTRSGSVSNASTESEC